jgi:uncharacterized protein (TIGR00661 family)
MKIFYGICGDGRGHAARSFALIEKLTSLGHEVSVFSFHEGYELFSLSNFPTSRLFKISGLRFGQDATGISLRQTIKNAWNYFFDAKADLKFFKSEIKKFGSPGLIISDFEPLLPRIANYFHIPCVTIDNQHKFCTPLRDGFSFGLQAYSMLAGVFISQYIPKPTLSIISTFHECVNLEGYDRIEIMLREQFANRKPTNKGHVLVYVRHPVHIKVSEVISKTPYKFIFYGPQGTISPNIEYKSTSYGEFADDLASCSGVICCGGNQLIGEAKYFGKKIMAIPLPRQNEQEINSIYVKKENLGECCYLSDFSEHQVEKFLNTQYKREEGRNGLSQVLELLKPYLH